jgi:hypothetical protein
MLHSMRTSILEATREMYSRATHMTAPIRSWRVGLPEQRANEHHRNNAPLETIHRNAAP